MMTYTRMQNRLGMTAIAAVLALSSTSLAAQEVPDTTAPVEAPTTTTTTPEATAPAADPLAPVAEPEATAPAEETTAATEAAPAAKPVAKKAATKTVSKAKPSSTKVASTAPSAAPAAPAPVAEAAPAPAPVAAAEPAPEVAPVAEAQPAKDAQIKEALPIAGGAGAVILALAGAGMAVRRKRRREDEEYEHNWIDDDETMLADEVQPEPEPVVEPQASWDPPVHAPELAAMPAAMQPTEVPDDFDTSGFGRHVKAAYEGPTAENPSLSLRKRLKIAGELDRREREAGINLKPAGSSKPVTVPAPKGEKMAMSFGGTATHSKANEYQL